MSSRGKSLRAATLVVLLLLLVPLRAGGARQATDASQWIDVSPSDEGFSVEMPEKPSAHQQQLHARSATLSGRLYTAKGHDSLAYFVWSLRSPQDVSGQFADTSDYLDACAELAWDLIVTPEYERAQRDRTFKPEVRYGMSYVREARVEYFMREYRIDLNTKHGKAHIFTGGAQTYIVAAYGLAAGDANVETFLNSFAVKTPGGSVSIKMPAIPESGNTGGGDARSGNAGTGAGSGLGPGRGGNTGGGDRNASVRDKDAAHAPVAPCGSDSDQPLAPRGVTRRAQVIEKPEPLYDEWARRFSVTGTVRLRAVLSRDGTVTNIAVVTGLPHGLTRKSIEAMRRVKFIPAEKDGCKVSQYVRIDYNFNIY